MNYCPLYGVAGCALFRGIMSMKKRSGLSELSVISWVSAVEECPLSGRGSTVVILTILCSYFNHISVAAK